MRCLDESMRLAAECHIAWLDPDKGYYPTGGFEVAHDTGRWWDAILRYEHVSSWKIPEKIEEKMLNNLKNLMDNDLGLLLNNPNIDWLKNKVIFNSHNFREGIMALAALAKYRDNEWAHEAGHRFLETLDSYLMADGKFDYNKMAEKLMIPINPARTDFESDGTTSGGRAIEAILWFYEATGDQLALKVAGRLADYHLKNTLNKDGSMVEKIISPDNIGHNHSYLGTLRGILLYGLITGSKNHIEAVSKTYDFSIWENNVSFAGWAPHDLGKARFNNEDGDPEADPASCGDVAQIALWLALRANRPELLDDAERLVRATLIPSQIINDPNPRINGSWGIHRHPFGQGSILDVFAAVLHTLTDVYQNIISVAGNKVNINMHFDAKTKIADIFVKEDSERIVSIILKKDVLLRIRIPGWADEKTIIMNVNENKVVPVLDEERYLNLKGVQKAGSVIQLKYELPIKETIEKMKISGREFKLTWCGDSVIKCSPEVPIYPK